MKLRPAAKPPWPALRRRVADVLAESFPAVQFEVAAEGATPEVGWEDGPAEGSVAAALGDVPGWRYESSLLGPDPEAPRGLSVLRFRRRLSVPALAVGVVRFRGARPRPFASSRPGAVDDLWAILEEDDPAAAAGFPLVAAMADDLLRAVGDDAPAGDTLAIADELSRRLEALGYDAVWSRAWATATL